MEDKAKAKELVDQQTLDLSPLLSVHILRTHNNKSWVVGVFEGLGFRREHDPKDRPSIVVWTIAQRLWRDKNFTLHVRQATPGDRYSIEEKVVRATALSMRDPLNSTTLFSG